MFQTINSHLSMAIAECTSTIMHQAPIYDSFLSCFFEHKGHCSTNLRPASSISYFEHYRKSGLDVHTHASCHACSLAFVYYVCVCMCVCVFVCGYVFGTFITHWLGNGWPTGENGTQEPPVWRWSGDGRVNHDQELTHSMYYLYVVSVCWCKPTRWHRETVLEDERSN